MIQKTKNYKLFKKILGNREINSRHLAKLSRAIEENDLLAYNPIMVNGRMEVLDGQHRLEAAETLGRDIYYVVIPVGGMDEVQMLNTHVRGWNLQDYLNSFVALGKEEYIKVKDFSAKNNISPSLAAQLLNGGIAIGIKSHSKFLEAFRSGDYKVTTEKEAKEMVSRIHSLKPHLEASVDSDREFLLALAYTYKAGFSHEQLLKKMRDSGTVIRKYGSFREYVRTLEDVLSWHSPVLQRIHTANNVKASAAV